MSRQGYRISQYEEIEAMNELRRAHELEEERAQAPVEDRVERARKPLVPPPPRVDVSKQFDMNLRSGPLSPERLSLQRAKARVVRTEPSARDYEQPSAPPAPIAAQEERAASPRGVAEPADAAPDELPDWARSEQALEEAVDYNEEILLPASRHPLTTGAVAEMDPARTADEATDPETSGQEAAADGERTLTQVRRPADEEPTRTQVRPRRDEPTRTRIEAPASRERTEAGFVYRDGGSYMAEFAAGAQVASGDGKSFEPARTQTALVDRRKKT